MVLVLIFLVDGSNFTELTVYFPCSLSVNALTQIARGIETSHVKGHIFLNSK